MPDPEQDRHESLRLVTDIRVAIPTSRHAEVLFETTAAILGERAYLETPGERVLFVRDPEHIDQIVPWPLLRLATGEHYAKPGRMNITVLIDDVPYDSDDLAVQIPEVPRPPPPRIRGLKPGELTIVWGAKLSFTFDDDGVLRENVSHGSKRAGEELALLRALHDAVQARRGIEALAETIAGFDLPACGPARVIAPPAGGVRVEHAWNNGLAALRRALWNRPPAELPDWLVADGFAGRVVATGSVLEETVSAWRRKIEEEPPRIERRPPEVDVVREMLPWESNSPEMDDMREKWNAMQESPPPSPPPAADMPMAIVRLCGSPPDVIPPLFAAAGFTRWQPLLGSLGQLAFGLVRDDFDSWLLAGQDVLDYPHPDQLDAEIDRLSIAREKLPLDAPAMEIEDHFGRRVIAKHWRHRGLAWRNGELSLASALEGGRLDPAGLDGDIERRQMLRLKYVD